MPDNFTELRAIVDGTDTTSQLCGRTIKKETEKYGVILRFSAIAN